MHTFVPPISDAFLNQLITEIDNDTIRGIVLGGSHARGEPTPSLDARAKLALRLYRETAFILLPTLSEQRRAVVEHVLHLVEQAI